MSELPVRQFLPSFRDDAKHRARNPSGCRTRGEMDSGFALRAPRNDEAYDGGVHHASMHGRFLAVRGSGFGTERRPDMIQCLVSAGSMTSSISSTEAIETALPLA